MICAAYLLVKVPVTRAPTELWVIAPYAIDSGLRVDCQEAKFVYFCKLRGDGGRFGGRWLVRPWESFKTARTESTK